MTTIAETAFPAARRPLRLWPGIVAVVVQWVSMFVVPALFPAAAFYGIMGGPAAGLIVILWWLFFSRAPWVERLGRDRPDGRLPARDRAPGPRVARGRGDGDAVLHVRHSRSCASPWCCGRSSPATSRPGRVAWRWSSPFVLACAFLNVLRLDGISGTGGIDWEWRWTPTAEEQLLAELADEPEPIAAAATEPAAGDAAAPRCGG